MKKLILGFFLVCLVASVAQAQKKLSKEDRAKLTPEQRIVYENSFRKKGSRKVDSMEKKVKRAKKEDRKSRRLREPKKHALKKR